MLGFDVSNKHLKWQLRRKYACEESKSKVKKKKCNEFCFTARAGVERQHKACSRCVTSLLRVYFFAIKKTKQTTTTNIRDGDWWSFLVEVPLNRNSYCRTQLRKAQFTNFIINFEEKKARFQRLTLLPVTAWANWTVLSTFLFSRVKGKTLSPLNFHI